ncbi:DNA polymerase III subunit delta' [Helicobacter sp. MIT 05-5294]|uniref:DNA polymerase III subunit delta' n=1 Tax=Helicobacter sp. MIT 05-5294 TaxID=1548150 RepID=UPI000A48F6A1|nr:DNA polymerase III subunit delta' [Helicobacter sp. MIT 05-5294]TLD86963.1 DNA polymerase III subunit delta [Helicobacter sp. MIT 05-5294]
MQDSNASTSFTAPNPNSKIGHILLVNDPISEANAYYEQQNPQNYRLFCAEELNIETSRAIIDESYIASEGTKTILIAANSFNIYAQNALLKVLEEPPSGIVFILYARMKSLLLPTIRSRLPILKHITKQKLPHFALEIRTLNLENIYLFLKEKQKEIQSTTLKAEIQSLYLDAIKSGLHFDSKETQIFERAILWEEQHEKPHNILLVLLLLILRKKKQTFVSQNHFIS